MEDTAKTGISQGGADFTVKQAAEILNHSKKWVRDNRGLFSWYFRPGRGPYGREVMLVRDSVLAYRERLRNAAQGNGLGDQHETVDQIIQSVKTRRALAGESL